VVREGYVQKSALFTGVSRSLRARWKESRGGARAVAGGKSEGEYLGKEGIVGAPPRAKV
jgi:hypothetical protein